jgi:hypothetical protein
MQMSDAERRILQFALECSDGSTAQAAARLGVTYHFLRRRAGLLGLIETEVAVDHETGPDENDDTEDARDAPPPARRSPQRRRDRPSKSVPAAAAEPAPTRKQRKRQSRRTSRGIAAERARPSVGAGTAGQDEERILTAEEANEDAADRLGDDGDEPPTKPDRPALRVLRNSPEE